MNKFTSHEKQSYVPRAGVLPVIQKLSAAYKLWHEFLHHFPKTARYTLGEKIDALFIEIIELIFLASYLYKGQKTSVCAKSCHET